MYRGTDHHIDQQECCGQLIRPRCEGAFAVDAQPLFQFDSDHEALHQTQTQVGMNEIVENLINSWPNINLNKNLQKRC